MYKIGYNIPSAILQPNTTEPKKGDVAIMKYEKDNVSTMHYAYVEDVFVFTTPPNSSFFVQNPLEMNSKPKTYIFLLISECNMFHLYQSGCGQRFISDTYPHLLGFYQKNI